MTKSELVKRIQDDLKTLTEMNDKHYQYFHKIDNGDDYTTGSKDNTYFGTFNIVTLQLLNENIRKMTDQLKKDQHSINKLSIQMNDKLLDTDKIDITTIEKEYNMEENFEMGMDAYNSGDYEEALIIFKSLAKDGHDAAQYHLGFMYLLGFEVNPDPYISFKWFQKSAEQGNAEAQFRVGYAYYLGIGTIKNLEESEKWLIKADNQGHFEAKKHLASVILILERLK